MSRLWVTLVGSQRLCWFGYHPYFVVQCQCVFLSDLTSETLAGVQVICGLSSLDSPTHVLLWFYYHSLITAYFSGFLWHPSLVPGFDCLHIQFIVLVIMCAVLLVGVIFKSARVHCCTGGHTRSCKLQRNESASLEVPQLHRPAYIWRALCVCMPDCTQ